MSQQLDLFRQATATPLVVAETAGQLSTSEGQAWNTHAGPMSMSLTIPAADLSWLREVVADYLAQAAKLRKSWGMAFTPNLVVEASEPDAAEQVVATVRATHFEGWCPTPDGAAWWFRRRIRKEATA
jgi:hypothetical protein